MYLSLKIIIYTFALIFPSEGTIDVNLSEYRHLADHLTEEECHRLVAALHFQSFDLPNEMNSAERRLPDDVPCLDLLLHWNSSPNEGKGKSHVEVCHRLRQIGRDDLADWLSKTVFRQISRDIKMSLNSTATETTERFYDKGTEFDKEEEEIPDEASWWMMDSVFAIFIVMGLLTLVVGAIFLCYLCLLKKFSRKRKGYKKLSTDN